VIPSFKGKKANFTEKVYTVLAPKLWLVKSGYCKNSEVFLVFLLNQPADPFRGICASDYHPPLSAFLRVVSNTVNKCKVSRPPPTPQSLMCYTHTLGETPDDHRVHTEWQWPLSGVNSIMMVKSARPGEGGGVHAVPLTLYLPSRAKLQYIRSSWEDRYTYTPPISPIHLYVLCGDDKCKYLPCNPAAGRF
jgi:hypothetical protein